MPGLFRILLATKEKIARILTQIQATSLISSSGELELDPQPLTSLFSSSPFHLSFHHVASLGQAEAKASQDI
jgi:hypothetical protein